MRSFATGTVCLATNAVGTAFLLQHTQHFSYYRGSQCNGKTRTFTAPSNSQARAHLRVYSMKVNGRPRTTQERRPQLPTHNQPPNKLNGVVNGSGHKWNHNLKLTQITNAVKQQTAAAEAVKDVIADDIAKDDQGKWVARGLLVAVAALYGTNFGCVKILETSLPASTAAAMRFLLAFVVFSPFLKGVKPEVLRAGAEVGFYNAIGYWAQSQALLTTTASKSAFICSLAVIFVPILDALFKKGDDSEVGKKKNSAGWTAALLATLGVACLELGGLTAPNVGDLYSLVQPVCFGLGFWRMEDLSRRYPGDALALTGAQLLSVAACAVAWCVQSGEIGGISQWGGVLSSDWHIPAAIAWTGVVTTALTIYMETLALKKLSAAESTVIFSTEPLWGTLFAGLVLGEQVGWNTGVGAALILSGCVWSSVGPRLQLVNLLLAGWLAAIDSLEGEGLVVNAAKNIAPLLEFVKDLLFSSEVP